MSSKSSQKVSFVATVFNEEKTIERFVKSILAQSRRPNEIIIVDGGSTDRTLFMLKSFKDELSILKKNGNRSVGRNFGIKHAEFPIVAISDAGCILKKDWIEQIIKPFDDTSIDVVSGYYMPIAKNTFEKSLAAYTCTMPDKLSDAFNPSSRSIAFRKKAWQLAGGYPEFLDTCEDMVFVKKLRKKNMKFILAKQAVVFWRQRKNYREAFSQFFSYAYGDGLAHYFRIQTPLLFLRYAGGVILLFLSMYSSNLFFVILIFLLIGYIVWAVQKNYRYVKDGSAFWVLPTLQFISDIAVISGTSFGYLVSFLRAKK